MPFASPDLLRNLTRTVCKTPQGALYTNLETTILAEMKRLDETDRRALWKTLNPRKRKAPDVISPTELQHALLSYVKSRCPKLEKGLRSSPLETDKLQTVLGTTTVFLSKSPKWKQTMQQTAPSSVDAIERTGSMFLQEFMTTVLESAHLFPRTIAKLMAAVSESCLSGPTQKHHEAYCQLASRFLCLIISDLDQGALNMVQYIVVRQLKRFCVVLGSGSRGRRWVRQFPSFKHALVDMIRTSRLSLKEKDRLVAILGGIGVWTDLTYDDVHHDFLGQLGGGVEVEEGESVFGELPFPLNRMWSARPWRGKRDEKK